MICYIFKYCMKYFVRTTHQLNNISNIVHWLSKEHTSIPGHVVQLFVERTRLNTKHQTKNTPQYQTPHKGNTDGKSRNTAPPLRKNTQGVYRARPAPNGLHGMVRSRGRGLSICSTPAKHRGHDPLKSGCVPCRSSL